MEHFRSQNLEQENQENSHSYVTPDIVEDILCRLDVKTLCRLKCVSRAYRNLISDPRFLEAYRQNSLKNIKFLSCSSHQLPLGRSILSFYSISGQSFTFSKLCKSSLMGPESFCLVSRDLVCFTNGRHIYVCNPGTNECCLLPSPSTTFLHTKLGFGYAASTGEYKVVHLFPNHLVRHKRPNIDIDTKIKGMESDVLCLSNQIKISSSSWKPLKCPRSVYPRTISTSGRIYWLIDHKASLRTLKTDELLLSFDIASDTFSILPRPPDWRLETYKNSLAFMVLSGNLCITDKRSMQRTAVLDIWMLKEDCSWINVFSFHLLEYSYNGTTLSPRVIQNLHPLGMVGGEVIFGSGIDIFMNDGMGYPIPWDRVFQDTVYCTRNCVLTHPVRRDRGFELMNDRFLCNIETKTLHKVDFPGYYVGGYWESFFPLS